MKAVIRRFLEIVSFIGFFAVPVLALAFVDDASRQLGMMPTPIGLVERPVALLAAFVVGLLVSVLVFGVLFLLIEIAENTKKTRLLLEKRS